MARYVSLSTAAHHFERHPRTIDNWLKHAYIRGYRDPSGSILVDLDEMEGAIKLNSKMRDGRRRYGNATILPLPIQAEVVAPKTEARA